MFKLIKDDLIPYEQYVHLYDKFLKEVISEKKVRRIRLSDQISGLFESKLTVLYQIQEMIRAEKMTNHDYMIEMLEVYNDLLPEPNEITMTIFIEIPNQEELRQFNKTIVGIEKQVELIFSQQSVRSYEPGNDEDEHESYTQSIHYLHFPFSNEQKAAFMNAETVSLQINHPNYQAETELSKGLIKDLKKQLTL